MVSAAAWRMPSTVRANSGSLRIDAPNSRRNDDRSPTANWKYARNPASTRSRPDVARAVASASAVEEAAARCR